MCMLLFAITNWTIMMSPRQVEVQSFSFKVEFSEKKSLKLILNVYGNTIFIIILFFVFFFTGSPGCVLATLSRQVNCLSTYSKFENLKIIHFLLFWLQAVHKLPVMVEKLRVENNHYNY